MPRQQPNPFDASKWDEQFYTVQDALKDREPIQYVIQRVLPEASLTVVYGLPGSHKTNIVMDAAICVALGQTWLQGESFKGFEVVRKPVLWIDADSGEDVLHERFGASLNGHGKNAVHKRSAALHYASFLEPSFIATEDAAVNAVIERALKLHAGLIVFDNLGTISGGVDENSSQMIPIMNRLRFIATKTKAAVIVIHHMTKNGSKNGERKSPRGHGSIEAAVDSAFWVEAEEDTVTLTHTKARRIKRLSAFSGIFEHETKSPSEDMVMMRFVGVEPELPEAYVKAKRTVLDYFKARKEGNKLALEKVLMENKIGRHKARSIIATFERCGLLKVKPAQAHNQSIYELGDAKSLISTLV